MKKALIAGITGQDGSYLAEFLLARVTLSSGSGPLRASPIHPNTLEIAPLKGLSLMLKNNSKEVADFNDSLVR